MASFKGCMRQKLRGKCYRSKQAQRRAFARAAKSCGRDARRRTSCSTR